MRKGGCVIFIPRSIDMQGLTREIVHFLWALEPSQLDAQVIDRAKYLLLDYLGVAIRGSLTESSRAVYRMLDRARSHGECTVFGQTLRAAPEYSALANGSAAHSIELDDTHQAGSIHLGVVMYSVAIALSESAHGIDMKRFIAAVAAGYEMAARLGIAVQAKDHYELGFHPTATCGVFGAAVTAAKLLGLTEEQMLSAVGIAGSMASGSLEFLANGAWTKRLHPGLAAQHGIQAAMLAADGFRGPETILEGRDGFLSSYARNANREAVTHALGETFEILRTSVKPHACCRYMQTPIDALLDLVRKYDIQPDAVGQVEIAVLEAGWPLVCEPEGRKYKPETIVDAQFSMPFGAAVAIQHRAAGLDQFTDENLKSPEIRRLMGRIVLTKDHRIEKNFPAEWRSRVIVYLSNGDHFENYVRHPKGDPENPLSWHELLEKFRALTKPVLKQERIDDLEKSVQGLSQASDLRRIWRLGAG